MWNLIAFRVSLILTAIRTFMRPREQGGLK